MNYRFVFLICLSLFGMFEVSAQCVNPNLYTTTFNINNTSPIAYTNKTVLVVMNTAAEVAAGHMTATGSDIRFGSSCCAQFPYWIDSTTMNTASTQIWVRVPSIAASSVTTLKMYHGAASLTSQSNFNNTFPSRYILASGVDSLLGPQTYDWFEVKSGATLYIRQGAILNITAERIIVNGTINGNAKGYLGVKLGGCAAGNGLGAGTTIAGCANGGGGGYGGIGGCAPQGGASACNSAGGPANGTSNGSDLDMGSSGSTGSQGSTAGNGAGNGGGALKLLGVYITVNGTVTVNGEDGQGNSSSSSGGGGGAGGGILIAGGYLNLTGANLSATGGKAGNSYGGCGSGGRIKLFRKVSTVGTYTTSVAGSTQHTYSGTVLLTSAYGSNGSTYADTLNAGQLISSFVSTVFQPCGLIYFNKAVGALNDTLSWGTNANGTGTNPPNFNGSGAYYYIVNNGSPTITSNWFVTGTNSAVIFGDGVNAANVIIPSGLTFGSDTFYVNNNMTMTIQGSILANKPGFDAGSTAQYTLTSAQNVLATNYGNLVISGSTKTLLGDVGVRGTLLMLNSINCNGYALTLGSSATQPGALNRSAGTIIGKLNRWFGTTTTSGASGLFPIGNATSYRPVQIDFTSAPTSGGMLSCEFVPSAPGNIGFPLFDFTTSPIVTLNKTATNGYWRMLASNGISGGTYTISATGSGFFGISSLSDLRLVRRASVSVSWTLPSTSVLGSGTIAAPIGSRTGVTALGGEFAMASDSAINTLPVQLLSFTGKKDLEDVKLSWTTASEVNNNHFEVQKQTNHEWFSLDKKVMGSGNSNMLHQYSYTDKNAFSTASNEIYYRLKIVDVEGNEEYSDKIIVLNTSFDNELGIKAIPNPFKDNLNLTVESGTKGIMNVELYDITGHVLFSQVGEVTEKGQIAIEGADQLSPGCYFLKIQYQQQSVTVKIMKE